MSKKKKEVIVEHRYTGDLPFMSWREWHKWRAYLTPEIAARVVDNLNRKYKNFEFRIRPSKDKENGPKKN